MSKLIKIITLLIFIIISVFTGSEAGMENPIKETTLKNGLKVIIKPVSSAPVVSVFVWYKVGSRNEPAGQSGLAHFLEHMMFKGSRKFGKGEISRLIGRTGGQQNAFTSYDYTAYYETVPKAHLGLALEIEADRMRHALLEAKEVKAEKTVILSELDGGRNHPQVRLRELVNAHTWVHHPYRRPVIGWKREVEKLTAEQLRAFYDLYYQPNNATLVIVGDVSTPALMQQVKKYFGSIPKGKTPEPMDFSPELGGRQKRVELHDDGPVKLCRINISIPNARSEEHFALTVLNDVLVKGKTARLYKALVDTGLATDVSAGPYEMLDQGYWSFSVNCTPQADVKQIETVLFEVFDDVKKKLLNQREFQQAINQTKAQLVFAKDSLTDQAMMLGFYQTIADDYRRLDVYPEKVSQVTKQQVRELANKYLNSEMMTIGWFIPQGQGRSSQTSVVGNGHRVGHHPLLPQTHEAVTEVPGPTQVGKDAKKLIFKETDSKKLIQLDNGLTIILQRNTSNPMIVLSGIIDAGQIHQPKELPGLALLHARLLDKGNQRQSAEAIAEALEFKGIELSFQAQLENLDIHAEALSEDSDLLITTLAECLIKPTFPDTEIKKAADKLVAQSHVMQDNADQQAWHGFYEMAYPKNHPMQRSLLTAQKGLAKIQRQDLIDYHHQMITPERTIISISGDLDLANVSDKVKQAFQQWEKGEPCAAIDITMKPVSQGQIMSREMKGKHESLVVMGHEGIHRLDENYYKLFLANHLLGGSGLSSTLMKSVRDQHGLTYGIYSFFKLSKAERPWCVVFQADPNKVNQAIELTKKEIKALQAGKLSASLLKDAKEQLAGRLVMNLETNDGLAYLNREIAYHHLGWSYMEDYPKAVNQVTYSEMVQMAKEHFDADRLLISIAGPSLSKSEK